MWRRLAGWAWELASSYLPLVLMGLLALATWWLVRLTPLESQERGAVAVRHEPDYRMERFVLRHYERSSGVAGAVPAGDSKLQYEVEGAELLHYPDTDALELRRIVARWRDTEPPAQADARVAWVDASRENVKLRGDVRYEAAPWVIETQALDVHGAERRIDAVEPVRLVQGTSVLVARGLSHSIDAGVTELRGPIRASWPAAAVPSRGGTPGQSGTPPAQARSAERPIPEAGVNKSRQGAKASRRPPN